jgi:hypothetical protein
MPLNPQRKPVRLLCAVAGLLCRICHNRCEPRHSVATSHRFCRLVSLGALMLLLSCILLCGSYLAPCAQRICGPLHPSCAPDGF